MRSPFSRLLGKTAFSSRTLVLSIGLAAALPVLAVQAAAITPPAPSAAPAALAAGPTLMSPADGLQMSQMSAALKWTPVAGGFWHHFQLIPFNNDGPGIDLIVGDTVKVAEAGFTVAAPDAGGADPNYVLLPGMTYTWRVRSSTNSAVPTEADWSDWASRTFRTPARSGTTIGPASPTEGVMLSSITPTLTWFNTDRTVFYYEIQVSKSSEFGEGAALWYELIHGGVSRPMNSYAIPSSYPLESHNQYFWRVRPRVQGDGAPANWSGTFMFYTS